MREDADVPLRRIRQEIGRPICSALLEIQKYITLEAKSLKWFRSLECLYMKSDSPRDPAPSSSQLLGRTCIDPFECGDYVAVSYVCNPQPGEDAGTGGYRVESRRTRRVSPLSRVRDVVWDRVSNFAAYIDCPNFWIDQECINQDDENEKEIAIQSMHLVYRHSDNPVALLTTRISDPEELDLLAELLRGSFVDDDDNDDEDTRPDLRLNPDMLESAGDVLGLLDSITSDRWWNRAWPFQEDYCAATKMTLLIPTIPLWRSAKGASKGCYLAVSQASSV
ncbi:hypothetical protein AYL99_03466 [Fonsecaea erecta]|uniref:Heterokaryon incompatibility domain-containing protein n=1 Tax=Fonsecaea erecta TaxID=1367422 RepID=A0A178ZQH9_9EURO|nr:hypothetical protein AYL99_03466 [Fonsecaea erecta]OAP61265.1 hypothetical protein AYL99_03466 [Fonsecaea erecta]